MEKKYGIINQCKGIKRKEVLLASLIIFLQEHDMEGFYSLSL